MDQLLTIILLQEKNEIYFKNIIEISKANNHCNMIVKDDYIKDKKNTVVSMLEEVTTQYVLFLGEGDQITTNNVKQIIEAIKKDSPEILILNHNDQNNIKFRNSVSFTNVIELDYTIYAKVFSTKLLFEIAKIEEDINFLFVRFIDSYKMTQLHSLPIVIVNHISNQIWYRGNNNIELAEKFSRLQNLNIVPLVDLLLINYYMALIKYMIMNNETDFKANTELYAVTEIEYYEKFILSKRKLYYDVLKALMNEKDETIIYKKLKEENLVYELKNSTSGQYKLLNKSFELERTYSKKEPVVKTGDLYEVDYYSPLTKKSIFLFMDRTNKADDNAEYLYRYFKEEKKEFKNIYFAIDKKSDDWYRLQAEGFNLVAYGSAEYKIILSNADVFISSQAYEFEERCGEIVKDPTNSRRVYLQHGIMFNDLTEWILNKKFDLFVTTGEIEFDYVNNLLPKETINSGLPRLQYFERKKTDQKVITYVPTWRLDYFYLTDAKFKQTDYYKEVSSIINNPRLSKWLKQEEIILEFKLHPNFEKFNHIFELGENVRLTNSSYREILENTSFLVTDYSSIFMDAAFLDIPICLIQTDIENFVKGHTWKQRLSYENDGLGPVFHKVDEVINYMMAFQTEDIKYKERKRKFFKGVDKMQICEKIFERVMKL